MDITWHVNQKLISDQGKTAYIEPLHIWEDVKIGNMRYSFSESTHVMDIEYQNHIYKAIHVGTFVSVD